MSGQARLHAPVARTTLNLCSMNLRYTRAKLTHGGAIFNRKKVGHLLDRRLPVFVRQVVLDNIKESIRAEDEANACVYVLAALRLENY